MARVPGAVDGDISGAVSGECVLTGCLREVKFHSGRSSRKLLKLR